MVERTRSLEATGVIADLFAEEVGFYATWGFSRSITDIRPDLLTLHGNVDWKTADGEVQTALVDIVAKPSSSPQGCPDGALGFGPDLFAGVAVGQHFSGWGTVSGQRSEGLSRLVLLRCHVGKRRAADRPVNAVLMQYRVWVKRENGAPRQILEAAKAWPLLQDLHAEVERRLAE